MAEEGDDDTALGWVFHCFEGAGGACLAPKHTLRGGRGAGQWVKSGECWELNMA